MTELGRPKKSTQTGPESPPFASPLPRPDDSEEVTPTPEQNPLPDESAINPEGLPPLPPPPVNPGLDLGTDASQSMPKDTGAGVAPPAGDISLAASYNGKRQALLAAGAVELEAERDAYGQLFQLPGGQKAALISSTPVNYRDESSRWQAIRTDIQPNTGSSGAEYPYAVLDNRHQLYFSESLDNGYIVHFPEGDIRLGMGGELQLRSAEGEVLASVPRSPSEGAVDGDTLVFRNTYPFGLDELEVRTYGVAHDVVLTEKPGILEKAGETDTIVLREFVELPKGWRIVQKSECYSCELAQSDGGLAALDAAGAYVAEFPTPVI